MRWAVFGQDDPLPLRAFKRGLERLGFSYTERSHTNWSQRLDVDAVAIYGLRAQGGDILNLYRVAGVPVVVIDLGYMKRVNTAAQFETGYFQIGMNRLGWVPKQAPSDDRFLALDIQPIQGRDGYLRNALICGQVEYDASHNMTGGELQTVYEEMADRLSTRGLKVTFRGHPLAKNVRPNIASAGVSTLAQAIEKNDLIVTINSNSGLEALIAGKPVIATKPSHYTELSYPLSVPLALVRTPSAERVRQHLTRLAYAQWTATEISRGDAVRFLIDSGELHGQA